MSHIDQDALALLALGEVASDSDAAHLASCTRCRGELAELRRVVSLARPRDTAAPDAGPLEQPPPTVWDGIAAELGFRPESQGVATGAGTTPRRRDRPARPARAARPARRARSTAIVAAVGALGIAVGLGIAALPGVRGLPAPGRTPAVVSRATLDALPGWSGSSGSAELERTADGRLDLVVDVAAGQPSAGDADPPLREVWMMRSDHSGLMSVGFLVDGRGRFSVPAGIDPASYPVVDVSAEADDGNPAHSGDSIVRGTLAAQRSSA
jgi:hypothetical protein